MLVLPGAVGLLLMIFARGEGDGIKETPLLGVTGVIGTWIAMIAMICGAGSSDDSSSGRVVQDIPLRTRAIMDANPDMSVDEAAQHIVPPPTDPRHARVSTVRMPDGRVVVVACDPRSGPPPKHNQSNTLITKGEHRHD